MNPGTRLGPYEIVSAIGAGGMGEVYRARDSRLGRDVAIKVLASAFTENPDRLARFEREARVLAALNHPNIGAIHGVEDVGGSHALVLELVEGETLAERIAARGGKGLSIKEALDVARQVADALDAAHEKGIVHRDLKPANIKVTRDGVVKVLDFGLAKLDASVVESAAGVSESPTVTIGATDAGFIVGTAPYMSPEQARGVPVDKRADIWAFGCVLYEMLTGRRAFAGNTMSDTIAAILEHDPDWTALPGNTPATVRHLLQRCLNKDLRRRLRDIGDVRTELEEGPALPTPSAVTSRSSRRALYLAVAAAALASGAIAAIAVWNLRTAPETVSPSPARFSLSIPADVRLPLDGFGSAIAVSPDGRRIAFVGRKGSVDQIFLRTLQDVDAKPIPGTERASDPFFSPDSQWLAFFAGGKLLKMPVTGGAPVALCDAPSSRGGFWGDDGTMVFSPLARGSGILQVSANGGTPKAVTTLDAAAGETSHRQPALLPRGETLLFVAYGATYEDVSIVAQSLKTGQRTTVVQGAALPRYVPTGHLLYVQAKRPGTLMAVPFDRERSSVAGTPVPIVDGVLTSRGDYAHWGVASSAGMLVYAPGGFQEAETDLVLVDRKGAVAPLGTPSRRPYAFPRLSPDGRRLVITVNGIQASLWIYDQSVRSFSRLTFEGNNSWPIWTPDGRDITYAANRTEPWRLFSRPSDGSGQEKILFAPETGNQVPYDWTPDRKLLLYQDVRPGTGLDVFALPTDGDGTPRPIVQTRAAEQDARLSADGRWLAYASDESGRYEVYVQSFAGLGGKWQISTDGGREPVWAHSGREIFYRSGGSVMEAEVVTQPAFHVSTPRRLFDGAYVFTPTSSASYDVMPDDQHFVMIQQLPSRFAGSDFTVVLNWFEDLKRLVPTN